VDLEHLLSVWVVGVEPAVLLSSIAEQDHKVLRLRPSDLLHSRGQTRSDNENSD
jgi:hypothetical protein